MAEQNLWLTEQRPWPPEGLARMCAFGGDLLSSELKRLAHMISTDLRAQEIATAVDGPEPVFRMDFSTSIMTDGALRLRRLYWSVQRQIGGRFVARTFAYHRKTGNGMASGAKPGPCQHQPSAVCRASNSRPSW